MGWGRMFLLGNVGQQLDIGELQGEINAMQEVFLRNQQDDLEQTRGIAALRRENQELKLYLATLVRLLVARGVLKTDEVKTIVQAIEPDA